MIERGVDLATVPLFNKPPIYRDLEWIWEGYTILSMSRQMGMSGPQPLALSEILHYLAYRGTRDEDEREEFLHLVQHLDRIFIADYMARNKPSEQKPPGKPKR